MIVQKFGGTSMGSTKSIRESVAVIVKQAIISGKEPVVVASAMSGVTTQLLELARIAVQEKRVNGELLDAISKRHLDVLAGLNGDSLEVKEAADYIARELSEIENILKAIGVIGELPVRAQDAILATGEKLSARVLTCVLVCQGYSAEYVNLEKVIPESLPYESDSYWDEVEELFAQRVAQVRRKTVPVLTGFFGQTATGMLESVGRGYSDYCASLAGAALRASEIQIWTDVDGVLSANPNIVPEAFVLKQLNFDETAELAHFGAKVLHPFSVRPAVNAGIPLRILNTFNPTCPGTLIEHESAESDFPFKSITSKNGVTIVRITTPLMLLAHGYMAKVTRVFAKHKISMDLISTSEVSVSMSVEDRVQQDSPFIMELGQYGSVSLQEKQSIISLVGSDMGANPGTLGRVFGVIGGAGIKVNMTSLDNSLINLSFVVNENECDRAVQLLHKEFFSGR